MLELFWERTTVHVEKKESIFKYSEESKVQNLEDVAMQFNKNEVDILSGYKSIKILSSKVYSKLSIEFLNELSKIILKNKNSKKFSELISYGFWCRKSNIIKMSESIHNKISCRKRIGIPLTSYKCSNKFFIFIFFGLLNGNSNIIKLPSNKYDSLNIY